MHVTTSSDVAETNKSFPSYGSRLRCLQWFFAGFMSGRSGDSGGGAHGGGGVHVSGSCVQRDLHTKRHSAGPSRVPSPQLQVKLERLCKSGGHPLTFACASCEAVGVAWADREGLGPEVPLEKPVEWM